MQKPARVQVTQVGGWREHKDEQCQRHIKKKKKQTGKNTKVSIGMQVSEVTNTSNIFKKY